MSIKCAKKYNQNPHFLKKFSEGFPKEFYFILQEKKSLRKWFFIFPCILANCVEGTEAAAPAQQFLLRNGLMKLICYIYLKKDREMSWCHCQKRKDFEKFFYYYTQKLSIRFHERSKGSNNMKYINKDLDDFVFKKLFDGQGSEVDFVFPLKKYTYTHILFYKHLFKMRPSPGIFWLDGRCLNLVLRFDKK